MIGRPLSLLLVPPLSAWGGVPSMTLYWKNLDEALGQLPARSPELVCRAVTPPPEWRGSGVRRRICQRVVLPALLRQELAREGEAGRTPMVHVLDPHYAHLLPKNGRGSVTCHDLDALVTPGYGLAKTEERWRLRQLVRAGAIHAISGHTARDLGRFFPRKSAQVVVNHYGLSPTFCRRPFDPDTPHLRTLRASPDSGRVLHVGSNIERKNIPTLLRGFALAKARLPQRQLRLVKVGDSLHHDGFGPLLDELGIAQDLIHLGPLAIEPLVDVYNACTLFAFPSRYEGFGRPVIEAQACGLPCVLADSSSLPEVGGTAALYHPTEDARKMADQIIALLSDQDLRSRAIAAGLANAGRFTWQRHARTIVDSLVKLMSAPAVPA